MQLEDRSDKSFLQAPRPDLSSPPPGGGILVLVAEALAAPSRDPVRTFGSSSPNASPPAHIRESPQLHLAPPVCCISAAELCDWPKPLGDGAAT